MDRKRWNAKPTTNKIIKESDKELSIIDNNQSWGIQQALFELPHVGAWSLSFAVVHPGRGSNDVSLVTSNLLFPTTISS